MDFFYRRSQDSTYIRTYTRTPHALRNNDSRLNLTISKRGYLKIAFETASLNIERFHMKKRSKFKLQSLTDIKIFLLFLLDNIRYPIDYMTLTKIISDNVEEVTFEYEACLRELVDSEHLLFDEIDGERFYMISDSGHLIAAELYDRLDPEFREASIKSAAKYISLSKSNATISSKIIELPDKRFEVTMGAKDMHGKLFSVSVTVNSRAQAENMVSKFETNPDSLHRGILFCVTGKLEFLS